jgi:hypothetical protein
MADQRAALARASGVVECKMHSLQAHGLICAFDFHRDDLSLPSGKDPSGRPEAGGAPKITHKDPSG